MTTIAIPRRELAHRSTNGIEVSLFRSKREDRVTIELADARTDERVELEVASENALDAFYHPYTYAFAQLPDVVDTAEAVRL